jgi:serine/threonine protein kinase
MPTNDPQRETLLQTIEAQALVGRRFENLRRLASSGGNGNFSLIVTADDRQSGGRVALKFFNPLHQRNQYRWDCFTREPELLLRFVGEPDILQCIAPRNEFTVPFAHMGLTLDVPFAYYAVELAAGDVSEAILTDRWTAKKKLEVFRGMCRAVQRTHTHCVVHRDLKPGNFLIMADECVRLSDFGTARDLADPAGAVLGRYMMPPGDRTYTAPEMLALLHDVDPRYAIRADIYSLGVILFEMFSGTPLFFQIFDWSLVADLHATMNAVDRSVRVQTYEAFVDTLADARPLPSLSQFGSTVPNCLTGLLDRLYRSMAAIDYRRRLSDFDQIFGRINACLWVLQHEGAYQRLREQRARAKRAREEKQRLQEAQLDLWPARSMQ